MTVGDEENKVKAEIMKIEANEFFKQGHYIEAIDLYTKAIELNPKEPVYYGNRSFAHLRMESFGSALQDASQSISLDNKYIKGYYRRAAAFMSLGKFKEALKDYETVSKAKPNDYDAQRNYLECKKIVRRLAFEKAIAVNDDQKSVADSIDLSNMAIEEDYSGPKLNENGQICLEFMEHLLQHYKSQKKLHQKYAYQILLDIKIHFEQQPTLIEISVPPKKKFTVCGDIHGQFFDLLNIFELNGLPSKDNPYLFNGDFVDRGSFSVECIFTLFGFKLLYPDHFYMARGNHESQTMNQMYGFEGEVRSKYTLKMADLFTEVFNCLPLAHLINNKILVMHGGLFSDSSITLDDIRKVHRFRQPPEEGIMCELLWSDPQPQYGISPSKRGVGIQFGPDITEKFLARNKLEYIIRSHEVKMEGYEQTHDGKCVTVFSAPNYCDTIGNKGAFLIILGEDLQPRFTTYEAVPHPDVQPLKYVNPLLSFLS